MCVQESAGVTVGEKPTPALLLYSVLISIDAVTTLSPGSRTNSPLGIGRPNARQTRHPASAPLSQTPPRQPPTLLYCAHFHIPPPKRAHGNGRGVIERCFVRGDLNVCLCVCQEMGVGW